MLNKQMAEIDWKNQTAEQIKNLVRGLNPIMGAYTIINGKKLKFWKVEIATDFFSKIYEGDWEDSNAGAVLLEDSKKGLFIKAKDGIVSILEIQGENGKRMPIGDFLRGNVV
jgi:methionyl-tRNA formyltransferase